MQKADDWLLDLGDVQENARIRLNGSEVATAWNLPFQVRVGESLKPGRNILELEATNFAAKRIHDMDQSRLDAYAENQLGGYQLPSFRRFRLAANAVASAGAGCSCCDEEGHTRMSCC